MAQDILLSAVKKKLVFSAPIPWTGLVVDSYVSNVNGETFLIAPLGWKCSGQPVICTNLFLTHEQRKYSEFVWT